MTDQIVVRTNNSKVSFADEGDSGSLVMTVGPCPQPVGLVEAKGTNVSVNGVPQTNVYVTPIQNALNALQTAGGYTSLSIVTPTTCNLTTVQMTDTTSGVTSLVAANSADPDVIQAMNVLPDAIFGLPACAISPYAASAAGTVYPGFLGFGIDLSSHPAALDIYVDTLDPNNECIPAQIEGVSVDQLLVDESTDDGTGEIFY